MSFIFMYGNYKCQKMHLKKVTSSPLPVFFLPLHMQNKDMALKFLMPVVCMYFDHIFVFLDNLKISDFIGNYF